MGQVTALPKLGAPELVAAKSCRIGFASEELCFGPCLHALGGAGRRSGSDAAGDCTRRLLETQIVGKDMHSRVRRCPAHSSWQQPLVTASRALGQPYKQMTRASITFCHLAQAVGYASGLLTVGVLPLRFQSAERHFPI